MIALLLTLQIAAQAPAVNDAPVFAAQLVDGTTAEGQLTGWQDGTITLLVAGDVNPLAVEQIARLTQTSRDTSSPETAETVSSRALVGLRDGSTFHARDFKLGQQSGGDTAFSMVCNGLPMTIPNKFIEYVRFRDPIEALAPQWQELLDSQHDGDVIVIRRSATSLDYLEGMIRAITPENVQFDFEGDTIDVATKKLEGAIFFRQQQAKTRRSPAMRVYFGKSDALEAKTASLGAGVLAIETESGAIVPVRLADLARIDFTTGRIAYLGDLKPKSIKITPKIGSRLSAESLAQLLYAPRSDESFSGTPLTLAVPSQGLEQAYTKGMAIHSKTELSYRLRGEFQWLKAIVGLDPHRLRSGSVRLVISLDGLTAFDETIRRSDDPVELDIVIAGVNKLDILVDYGSDGDSGDRLHLCNLRVVK